MSLENLHAMFLDGLYPDSIQYLMGSEWKKDLIFGIMYHRLCHLEFRYTSISNLTPTGESQ